MRIASAVSVPVAPDRAWGALLNWGAGLPNAGHRGRVALDGVAYAGSAGLIDLDDDERTATFRLVGRCADIPASALATITGRLEATTDGGTRVLVEADLHVHGARGPAQDAAAAALDELAAEAARRIALSGAAPSAERRTGRYALIALGALIVVLAGAVRRRRR